MVELVKERVGAAWQEIWSPAFIKQAVWCFAFWVVTIIVIILNIEFLKTHYPDPVRPDDLLLDIFPENKAFVAIGDVMTGSLFALVVLYFGVWSGHVGRLPKLLFLLAIMYGMRAFVINLTPLAQIQPPSENFPEDHFIAQTFYHGMYFSGHTASAFIQAFFFKGHRHQWILMLLATGAALALIFSHSHYTIDVVGGFFVAYFIVKFDWMTLVPGPLKQARWAPWYNPARGDHASPSANGRTEPEDTDEASPVTV